MITTLLAILCVVGYAQPRFGDVKGKVVSRQGRIPVADATVIISGPESREMRSGDAGEILFGDLPAGEYTVTIEARDFMPFSVVVKTTGDADLGLLILAPEVIFAENEAEAVEFESEMGGDALSMPSTLGASQDIFNQAASYKFSAMRFKTRGYDSSTQDVYVNGIYFNDPMNGYTPWSTFGGLNEVTRTQESTATMGVADFGLGGINTSTNIDTRPSAIRKGLRVSGVLANNAYRTRFMVTYSSGFNDKGWAYAFSASTRQGGNDYADGVFYNTFGYYAGIEKKLGTDHRLSLTMMGAPTIRGVQAASMQEVYDLAGDNFYNPNWGYQDGKERNARVRNFHQPIAMLNYIWKPTETFRLTAAMSFMFGKNGYSALDWASGSDPRPDYYRNLPSYFAADMKNASAIKQDEIREAWWSGNDNIRQIDWDGLYNKNRNSTFGGLNALIPDQGLVDQINAAPANVNRQITDGTLRSNYVIEDRRADPRDFSVNVTASNDFSNYFNLTGGINARISRTEYYKRMKDLLGGDYWLDVDKFADNVAVVQGDGAIQNNLDNPMRLVKKGEKYGYDYYAQQRTVNGWALGRYNRYFFESYIGAQIGYAGFWRDGLYRKGLYPDDSKGDSKKSNYLTYDIKAGFIAKISGAHTVGIRGIAMEAAPYFTDAFLSPRTRNQLGNDVKTEKRLGLDLTYTLKMPWMKARLTGYASQIKDQTRIISFYDYGSASFGSIFISGQDQENIGMELGLEVPIVGGLSATGAFNWGRYTYTSDPYVTQTVDNYPNKIIDNEQAFIKGLYVGGTPQLATNVGLNYRSRNYFFLSVDFGFYNDFYIDINPHRRTDYSMEWIYKAGGPFSSDAAKAQAASEQMSQEKFKSAFIMNASAGKSWIINRKSMLGVNLNFSNLTNNQNIRTGGFEQMRGGEKADGKTVYPFGSKYYYMFGTTYYLQVYYRF